MFCPLSEQVLTITSCAYNIVPHRWLQLQNRIQNYQKELDDLGLRDYQVPGLIQEKDETAGDLALREMRLPFRIAETILLLLVSLLPALFLNFPVGLIARYWALHRREKALAASKVKVKGMDVMLSEKVLLCIVLVSWHVGMVCLDLHGNLISFTGR